LVDVVGILLSMKDGAFDLLSNGLKDGSVVLIAVEEKRKPKKDC
jgi:hypothetical protein